MIRIRKAVITAAGLGTRFLPLTKSQPKEMIPLVEKPLIQYSVEEAIACGAEVVVIVTSQGKRSIEDYFSRSPDLERLLEEKGETRLLKEIRRISEMADIRFVRQEKALGLGHAVLTTRRIVGNEPFLLLLPDDIFDDEDVLKRMVDVCCDRRASVIAAQEVSYNEVGRYGIIGSERVAPCVHRVTDLVEKPRVEDAPSNLAIMGRYVLTPDIFECLEETKPGRNGEIQLTDGLRRLLRGQEVYAQQFEGARHDAGTVLGWLKTTITMALRDPSIGPSIREHLDTMLESTADAWQRPPGW
jgi:UTP--glucose-1-phosphate uridylyltransferase